MRKLPQTNFDKTLALIYEQKISGPSDLSPTAAEELQDLDVEGSIPLGKFLKLGQRVLNISGMTLDKYDILNLVNDKLKIDLDIDEDLDEVRRAREDEGDDDFDGPPYLGGGTMIGGR